MYTNATVSIYKKYQHVQKAKQYNSILSFMVINPRYHAVRNTLLRCIEMNELIICSLHHHVYINADVTLVIMNKYIIVSGSPRVIFNTVQ